MFLMRFDVHPSDGQWIQPTTKSAGIWTVVEGPDHDVDVSICTRRSERAHTRWILSLSKSDYVTMLAAEDITQA